MSDVNGSLSNACAYPHKTTFHVTLARLALDGPVLPGVAETLPVAERVRRGLLAECRRLARRERPGAADAELWPLAPAFWGKDEHGRPRTGHVHAFVLPADEDGDGRLERVTVFAPMGFNALERQALGRLRRLAAVGADDAAVVHARLIGVGTAGDFRTPLLDAAAVWQSATPFVATRYAKRRGVKRDRPEDCATPRSFARLVLGEELRRRAELPAAVIEDVELLGAAGLRPIQFQRFRSKRADDGGRRAAGGFRIAFAEPVSGPLCLGHSCHFGLGLFVPASSVAVRAAGC